ncbi:fibronectin type III domain-containing protein [Paenibacillus sp. FSL K6-1318]|uniref:RCC1 domain-containing protein n=1 Tax=Paenibacillus sp. FSL K6-1318 TaxID=2975291 RepID=UPI0030EF41D7
MRGLRRNIAATIALVMIISLLSPLFGGVGISYAADIPGAPITTHSIKGNKSSNGIYYGAVELELIAQDTGSGVSITRFSLNDGDTWSTYTQPILFSDKKVYNVTYQSVSNNNRAETPKELKFTIKKDTNPPETTIQVAGTQGQNSYYLSPVTISLQGTDTQSSVDYTEYSLDGGLNWARYTTPITVNEEQSAIYYRSRDLDGNLEKTKKSKISIDTTAPTPPNFSYEPEEWSNSTYVVNIFNGSDEQSGVMKSQYRLDQGATWTDYTVPFNVSGEKFRTVYVRTLDNAGNISEVEEFTLQFDKMPPTAPKIYLEYEEWRGHEIYVEIDEGTDEDSKVKGYEYRVGSSLEWKEYINSFPVQQEGITKVYARTLDRAGNVSATVETEVKIDLTPPSPPENLFKVSQLGSVAVIRWSPAKDNLSGIKGYEIYNGDTLLGETKDTKFTITNLTLNEMQSISIVAIDKAENYSENSKPLIFFTNNLAVSAYRDHTFAWNQQGQVWGWGLNSNYQLGEATTANRTSATRITTLDGFSMISTGLKQNIGLRPDGTVWTWGANDYTNQRLPLTKVPGLEKVVSISAGLQHYMALKEDGTVWTWGDNGLGQLGVGGKIPYNSLEPVQVVGLTDVVAINGSYYNSMVLKEDGTVWIWGNGSRAIGYKTSTSTIHYSPIQISGLSNIVQIDMTYLHGLALRNDGTVWSWGMNESGQLGLGDFIDHPTPTQIPDLNNVIKITAGYSHSMALTNNGEVWTWGNNYYGEVGDGTTIQKRPTPVKAAHLKGATDIEAGEMYSYALKKNGSLWAWGFNTYGQLGNGATTAQPTRVLVNGINYPVDKDAPTAPGQLRITGKTSSTAVMYWDESEDNHAVKEYLVYSGSTLFNTLPVDGKSLESIINYTATGLAPGQTYTFTVKAKDYQGNISTSSNSVTVTTEQSFTRQMSGGQSHSLALKSDGSVWAWGYNQMGQLGVKGAFLAKTPIQIPTLNSITSITSGPDYNLALKSDGTVWAWGSNMNGQLANTNSRQQDTPMKIEGLDSVIAIDAGTSHALALKKDGTVWAWGSNYYGDLGLGHNNSQYAPTKIPTLSGVKSISAGAFFSFAIKSDGTVWAWGANGFGQLGDGTKVQKNVPIRIAGLTGVESISLGFYHGLALKQDGTVWAWGYNYNGQLGDGTNTERLTPVRINSLSGISQISTGNFNSLARTSTAVYSWGSNNAGELGTGGYYATNSPDKVASITSVQSIAAGTSHGMALSNNNLLAWGANSDGQLGNGLTTNSYVPVNVTGMSTAKAAVASKAAAAPKAQSMNKTPEEQEMLTKLVSPDFIAPTVPSNVSITRNGGKLVLDWEPSTDDVGVKEYWIYLNDELILKTQSYTKVEIQELTNKLVNITIKGVDEAGNVSVASAPVTP